MKKLIITCAILTAITSASFAHTPNMSATSVSAAELTPEAIAEKKAKEMQKEYGLTAAQYTGVYQAELDYQKQIHQAKVEGYELGEGQSMQMEMGKEQMFQNSMSKDQFAKYMAATHPSK